MKVHLIPSNDLDGDLYTRVFCLLQAVPGVNKFISSGSGNILLPDDIREQQEIPDKQSFEKKSFDYPSMHPAEHGVSLISAGQLVGGISFMKFKPIESVIKFQQISSPFY